MIFLSINKSSAIVLKSQIPSEKKEENSDDNDENTPHQQDRPEIVKKRDRALFGFMMNHLKNAKKVLENDNNLV